MGGRKHGHATNSATTPIYRIWNTMKQRCTNPNNSHYQYYGARGIKVCARWFHNFQNFLDDMGEPPHGHQLDRINNDGNYEPGNCRWVTRVEQARNKRTNRRLVFDGQSLTITEWAARVGIPRGTIEKRLDQFGWSITQALTIKRISKERRREICDKARKARWAKYRAAS